MSWDVLDNLIIKLYEVRALRMTTGVLDRTNPRHLEKELDDLKRKTPINTRMYRAIYGSQLVAVDCLQDWVRQVNFEKQLYQSPGQAPAPALMIKDGDTAKAEEEKIAAYRDGRMASTQGRRQPKAGAKPGGGSYLDDIEAMESELTSGWEDDPPAKSPEGGSSEEGGGESPAKETGA